MRAMDETRSRLSTSIAYRKKSCFNRHVPNPYGLIFRRANGQPISAKADDRAWHEFLTTVEAEPDKSGKLPTIHVARHTTATLFMELGVDQKIIGEIVGHASEQITQRYQHVSAHAARDAMLRLGTQFAQVLQ